MGVFNLQHPKATFSGICWEHEGQSWVLSTQDLKRTFYGTHTYLPTYLHTYLPPYIHTCMHAGITLLVAGTTESVRGASMELFARLFDTSTCERGTDLLFWAGAFNPKALESSVKLTERPTRTSHRPPLPSQETLKTKHDRKCYFLCIRCDSLGRDPNPW